MKRISLGRLMSCAFFFLLALSTGRLSAAEVEWDPLLGLSIPADGKGRDLFYEDWLATHAKDPAAVEVFRRFFELQSDAPRPLAAAARFFDAQGTPSPHDLIERTARLAEMLGKVDLALDLYLRAYASGAQPKALWPAVSLLSETGEGGRARELAGLLRAGTGTGAGVLPFLVATGTEDPGAPVLAASKDPAARLAAAFLSYMLWRDRGEAARAAQALSLLGKEFPRSPEFAVSRDASRIRIASTPGSFFQPAAPAQKPSPEAGAKNLAVQTGSFGMRENAEDMVKELGRIGYAPKVREVVRDGRKYFAVMASVGLDLAEGQAMIEALKGRNIEGFLRTDPGE